MIIGTGIDSIEPYRIEKAIKQHGKRFLDKIYTLEEQARCQKSSKIYERYAIHFAAKEAVMKMLETGAKPLSPIGVKFREIELYHENSGAPRIRLYGRAKQVAEEKGIEIIHLAATSLESVCTVTAIGERLEDI